MKKTKKRLLYGVAVVFWLVVWQLAAMAIGQEVFLVSPIQALGTLLELLPQPEFWQRIGFSAGRILLGFLLGAVSSVVLAVAAERWAWVEALLSPVMQLVKATPVASFIILALVWVSGSSLSILISFFMVLPVLYGAVRTGIESADGQLLEMARVFRLPLPCRVKAIWLPAVLPAFRQGCSVALGICWKSGVAAEVIGLPDGSIGDALYRAKITLSTGELFAWTFVIIVLSAAFEKLFLALLDKAVARACLAVWGRPSVLSWLSRADWTPKEMRLTPASRKARRDSSVTVSGLASKVISAPGRGDAASMSRAASAGSSRLGVPPPK